MRCGYLMLGLHRLWQTPTLIRFEFYDTFSEFKEAIDDCLNLVESTYKDQVKNALEPKVSACFKIRIYARVKYM